MCLLRIARIHLRCRHRLFFGIHSIQTDGILLREKLDKLCCNGGIKLRARISPQLFHRSLHRHSLPVRAIIGHGIVGINHRNYTGQKRDALLAQPVRIPLSVPSFMMRPDFICNLLQLRIAVRNFIARLHMRTHNLPLTVRELSGLVQNFDGNADFPDIVKQTQQSQLTLLGIGQSDLLSKLCPDKPCTLDMVLRVGITFLQGLKQGGKHVRMNGLSVNQLFGTHRHHCRPDALFHTLILVRSDTDPVLYASVKRLADLLRITGHPGLITAAADCNQIGVLSAHKIRLRRKYLSHQNGQLTDFLIPRILAARCIDHRQTVHIAHSNSDRKKKMLSRLPRHRQEILPLLEAGLQIGLNGNVRKNKHQPEPCSLFISQHLDIAAKGLSLFILFHTALHRVAVRFSKLQHRQFVLLHKLINTPAVLQLLSAQQSLRPFVMQNSVVLMIEQNNSLPDVLKNAGLHFVQHGMC